ncbi:hypothetical protein V498_08640, partial [Pseudogymnoascus sp. VKM F-4517 (FW-2822)]
MRAIIKTVFHGQEPMPFDGMAFEVALRSKQGPTK